MVRADLTANAASGSNGDTFAFDIAATGDVTALDSASNTVNASTPIAPNGGTSPTKIVTIKNGGSMRISAHADSPIKGSLYWGQTNAPVSKFALTATDESFFIETFTIAASAATEIVDASANVKQVILTYKNKAGATLTTTQAFTNTASAHFGWTSILVNGVDTRPYVPKDSTLDIDVAVNLRTKAEGATQDTFDNTNPSTPVFFSLDFMDTFNNSHTDGFRAVGDGSGTVLDGTSANIDDVLGTNNLYVYRVYPEINQVALPSPFDLLGTPTVFKFTITAMGLSDSKLRFDNDSNASGSIKFAIVSSGTAGGDSTVTTYEGSTIIDTTPLTDDGDNAVASYTFNFTSKDVEIVGGTTKTFRIQLDGTTQYGDTAVTGVAADYFQVVLRDTSTSDTDLIQWVGDYNGTTNSLDTTAIAGVIRNVPLYGPVFQR